MVCIQGVEETRVEANEIKIRTLLICIATIVLLELASTLVISRTPYGPIWVLGAARLLEICLIVLIVSIWGKGISSIGLAPSGMVRGFKKGLIWSAAFGLVTLFGFVALFLLDIHPLRLIHTPLPAKTDEIVIFFIVGGLVGPVAEEVFFRGVLYGFFRRWGIPVAILLSSALFVLAHLPGIPWTQLVGAVVFALAYEKAGSLTAPITIHVLGNSAIFTLSLIF
jgi:membrane protease YdiL (CAAX protease family)